MSHPVVRILEPERCESVLADINDFIDAHYTEANIRARRAHVYEYGLDMDAFAFPIHAPGAAETDHLPGYRLDELPPSVARLTERAVEALDLERGRVLWNVGRYAAHADALPAHYDGELFEFDADPVGGNTVHSGIRPREVALLTLRNESAGCQTTLHDADGKVTETRMEPGELLLFDNVAYQHGVPATGANQCVSEEEAARRWIRVTTGWRSMDEGFDWDDARELRPIDFRESIRLHDDFMATKWPALAEEDIARATLPFPRRYV
ncbi:MAG: hypothetical protein NXI30_01320 [bacterium]|nr:hypothetical protein [bacterium]